MFRRDVVDHALILTEWAFTDSSSFLVSYPTPSLKTMSTFSMSAIRVAGSLFITTRSAFPPNRDRADLIFAAEKGRAVQRRDADRLDWCEPGFDE